jgi:hypothetical protein
MTEKNRIKRAITILCIALVGVFSLGNCFGSFGIVKTVYSAHKGLRIGSGLLAKFIQTLLMYFPFSILYGIGFAADLILFNLVEFWTGSNPVAKAEFDMDGKLTKNFKNGNESVTLTYTEFGKKMKISVTANGKTEEFVALQEKEGVLFKEINGELKAIEISSQEIGSKTVLKMAQDGKVTSARVISTDELQALEKKFSENLF